MQKTPKHQPSHNDRVPRREGKGTDADSHAGCIEVIREFAGVVEPHLDQLVTITDVREWFCECFGYSEATFKATHLKELDQDYFRAFFGVRPKEDEGRQRLRPSTDRFYKSRVVWWLIERKKNPIRRYGSGETPLRPDPRDYE